MNQSRIRQSPVTTNLIQRSQDNRSSFVPTCYSCGQVGHFRTCPQSRRQYNNNGAYRDSQNHRGRGRGEGPSGVPRNPNTPSRTVFGNAATVTPHETHVCSMDDSKAQLFCGCCTPVVAGSCSRDCVNLPIYDGFVNDIPVKVLRDTGCTGVIVRRALVKPGDMVGKKRSMMLINRTVISVPIAMCHKLFAPRCIQVW